MAYDGTIMQRALARFDQAKQRRADELEQRRRLAFARQPRLAEIDRELRGTMGRIVTSALQKGTDPLPAIRVLRDENLELQRERAELLTAMGEPIDYLDDAPACPLCGDTGYRKGQVCDRFDYYDDAVWPDYGTSPRANMERNFDVCRDYAYQFSKGSGSLLLSGGTGLGKTFLSACIARVVSDGGYSVVYDTAGRIFSQFEEAKFRGDAEGDADAKRCQRCDLLIVDDLGTEMTTSFVQSALYQLVNGRLMEGKATIISTNLAPEELGARYGGAVLSRLEGEYEILPFFGEDIRRLKRQMQ